jgi:pro-apoptotic serine protease NMA111
LAPSLVMVNFDMPYSVSGVTEKNYHGTGVIVDAERGLVAIDRNTVPIAMGDVRVHLRRHGRSAGQSRVHPSAAQPCDGILRSEVDRQHAGSRRRLPIPAAASGEDVWVVGQRADSKIMSQKTQVASVDVLSFPLSRTLRFRDSNLEAASLVNPPGDYDGVLADDKGNVLALWSSFAFESQRDLEQVNRGIPADIVTEMIGVVIANRPLYSFEAEFDVQSSAGARKLGLPDAWVRRFEEHNPQRRQVLSIDRLVAGSPAARCSSRAICCSRSTARSSIASARSSARSRNQRSASRSGATEPKRP